MRGRRRAFLAGLGAYLVGTLGMVVLFHGWPPTRLGGILVEPSICFFDALVIFGGEQLACPVMMVTLTLPAALVALAVQGRWQRGEPQSDGQLHRLKCGYILKGLSAPRCPECGEAI
jgi:hypothetical protein